MSEKKNRVFLGQLFERTGKYGKFYSGRIGAAQLVVSESKETGKWNVYLEENTQRTDQPRTPKQDAFGLPDEIPY